MKIKSKKIQFRYTITWNTIFPKSSKQKPDELNLTNWKMGYTWLRSNKIGVMTKKVIIKVNKDRIMIKKLP
jgi:hypothetical protein